MLKALMPKMTWAVTVLVAALLLGFLSFRPFSHPRPRPSCVSRPIVLQVEGQVQHPDIYVLTGPSATLGDAIRAAGGIIDPGSGSPSEAILAKAAVSGAIVRAERDGSHGTRIKVEPMSASMRLLLGIKLDLNMSSVDELLCIPRMRPETAQAIVERRNARPWRSLEELTELPGVGSKTVDRWRSSLSVE